MYRRRPKLSLVALIAFAVVGLNSAALAHPGHGGGLTDGLAHPFSGLDHVLAMVAVGLWASQLGRRAMLLLPLIFPVVMAAGAVMGANGVALPWVEIGILASVVVLGAAVALGLRVSLAASAFLIGVFALFHGHAHGHEFPVSGSALLYGAGFVTATLALHLAGLAIGGLTQRPVLMRTTGGAIAAAGLLLFVMH